MVRARVSETAAFALIVLLSALAPSDAQVPPPPMPPQASTAPPPAPGFVPPYEIMRTVRKAGFSPLAPPLREGTTYVLRANDYRGILMRVVVDARTGAIRDANRIVPGPGRYGQFYSAPSPYDPADLAEPVIIPSTADMEPPSLRPLVPHGATRSALPEIPPLPRPRPAALASRKPLDDGNAAARARSIAKPQVNSEAITTAPPAASAAPPAPGAPQKSPAIVEPLND